MPIEFTTPVGRLVWGHPSRATQKRDLNTGKPIVKDDGTPAMHYAFGVAFDKLVFQQQIWPEMHKEALTGYPNGTFPQNFSWKYKDGDNPGVDNTGKPIPVKDGQAGCFVLTYTSELPTPPGVYKFENGQYRQLSEKEIKCGDYIAVGTQLQVNVPQNRTHTPSLYVNPRGVEHCGYGTEIATGGTVDPNAMFGGQQRQLPPGASATPIGGAGQVQMPGMGGGMPNPGQQMQPNPGMMPQPGQMMQPQQQQPMQYQQPGQMPNPGQMMQQPQYAQQQPMQQPYQPAHDFVHNAGQQQPMQYQQPGQMMQPGQMPGMMPPR